MKFAKILIETILTFLFCLVPLGSMASIDLRFQAQIQMSCVDSGKTKRPVMKDLELICECLAKNHYESAKLEPIEQQGVADLQWLLSLYRISDPKKLLEFSKTNEALVEYDLQAVESCLEKIRGK